MSNLPMIDSVSMTVLGLSNAPISSTSFLFDCVHTLHAQIRRSIACTCNYEIDRSWWRMDTFFVLQDVGMR